MPHTRGQERASLMRGPFCRSCRTDEAACAWRRGCCPACSHWLSYTADGNDRSPGVTGRRPTSCDHCRRIRRACTHRQGRKAS